MNIFVVKMNNNYPDHHNNLGRFMYMRGVNLPEREEGVPNNSLEGSTIPKEFNTRGTKVTH